MKKTAQNDVAEENSIQIGAAVTEQRLADGENMQRLDFTVTGMTCAACQANVEKCVSRLDGVRSASVNLLSGDMQVMLDRTKTDSAAIIDAVRHIGYGAQIKREQGGGHGNPGADRSKRTNPHIETAKALKTRLIVSAVLLVPLMYLSMGHMLSLPLPHAISAGNHAPINALIQMFIALGVIIVNRAFFTRGFKALFHRMPNMDSLVAIGSGAAFVYGVFAIFRMIYALGEGDSATVAHYSHELYFESAAMILTLVTVGKWLEERSKGKTSDTVDKLLDLAPKSVRVVRNGKEESIAFDQLRQGDIVSIRPGDILPADGRVTEGQAFLDQSAVTGESMPVEKTVGDSVISATKSVDGAFLYEATRVGEDTTLSGIIRLVEQAGNSKAPIARLADKISAVFVPCVMAIAAVTFAVWMIAGQGFEFALARAITVLVISCPCALGLATPVAVTVGTGKAAEYGILIKSAASLEALAQADTVLLDKTGTVTRGKPQVSDIITFDGMTQEKAISIAAAVESGSTHPIASAIIERAGDSEIPESTKFSYRGGLGASAEVEGRMYYAGNAALMKLAGTETDKGEAAKAAKALEADGRTLVFLSDGEGIKALIGISDKVRADSREAISDIKALGMKAVMLTGDNRASAAAVCREVGIDEAVVDILPADKEAQVQRFRAEGRRTVMIGDGINDSPALAAADVGMAIGAGTDIALDSADIILLNSSLISAAGAMTLSRRVMRNIKMNLFWAFFYNVLGIPIAAGVLFPAFGLTLSPMIGAAAMSLSSVCVVTNALRLRLVKLKTVRSEGQETKKENKKMNIVTLNVKGMMCAHCKAHVEKALGAVNGADKVEVDLENAKATVYTACDGMESELIAAVKNAGYEASAEK